MQCFTSVSLLMDWFHRYDLVYRNLKTTNMVEYEFKSGFKSGCQNWECVIAYYECSTEGVGT